MSARFLHGCDVLVPGGRVRGQGVLVESGRIAAVLAAGAAPAAERVVLPPECLLAPGLIDVQVNGGGGVLFNDTPTVEGALAMAAAHRRLGTTAILPTLITSEAACMRAAASVLGPAVAADAGVIGVHFEGPFLSPARPGVHRADLIRIPAEEDLALLESLAAVGPGRVVLTLAPECVAASVQERLAAAGVILCAGHSEASFEAVGAPIRGVTHVFNAMPPMSARAPGLAAATLLGDAFTGIIMDGIHVQVPMLRVLLAVKSLERIMLVSDSMSVAGTGLDEFMLQGRRILRRNGRLETEAGTLAGADLCLAQAVRNVVDMLGLDLAQAVAMASAVPAAFLRVEHERGRIAPGLRADLTLFSAELDVLGTWLGGEWQGVPGVALA
jgi:N-acetylglucosamine-6-phosphate deacetylase